MSEITQNNSPSGEQELKTRLIQNLEQLHSTVVIAAKLERKIVQMESSKFWKLRMLLVKYWGYIKGSGRSTGKKRSWGGKLLYLLSGKLYRLVRKFFKVFFKHLYLLMEDQRVKIVPVLADQEETGLRKIFSEKEIKYRVQEELSFYPGKPLISILMPVYNTPVKFLEEAIESVLGQAYPNWELCIADDCSSDKRVREVLESYKAKDKRIKVVYCDKNGHISASSNAALGIAIGEYVALLDHDDVITHDALYEVVRKINVHPSADFIYSDEDKLQPDGTFTDAYHKPDWCPDSLLSRNYITHFAVIKRSLINEVGGFRIGYEGSQDYDLFLRITELTKEVYHIPRILYHWRIHPGSTSFSVAAKNYATDAARKALEDSIARAKVQARVESKNNIPGYYTVRYTSVRKPKVSIIIPTKDETAVLRKCLESVLTKTNYENFEVIVVSNNSVDKSLFSLLKEKSEQHPGVLRYYEDNIPFNFSRLMNRAVQQVDGDMLLFLNNDTEVIHADWLDEMVGQAERESIGMVGAKLLYPDDTIQHAGVVIGLGGIAGHLFAGERRDALGYFCQLSTVNNYSAVTGACMLCRKSVFHEAGGFDEAYAVEFNDIDLCLKIRELGYHNVYLPQVELYHHESLTRGNPFATEESTKRHNAECDLFVTRWQKYMDHDPCVSMHLDKNHSNYQLSSI